MGLIIDTSVLVSSERRGRNARQALVDLVPQGVEIGVSVVTALELAHGVERANTSPRKTTRQLFLNDLLQSLPIYPVTVPIALRAGRLDGLLAAQGIRIDLADLLIAATALELGYELLTDNVKHFERIPQLLLSQLRQSTSPM